MQKDQLDKRGEKIKEALSTSLGENMQKKAEEAKISGQDKPGALAAPSNSDSLSERIKVNKSKRRLPWKQKITYNNDRMILKKI